MPATAAAPLTHIEEYRNGAWIRRDSRPVELATMRATMDAICSYPQNAGRAFRICSDTGQVHMQNEAARRVEVKQPA